MTEELESHVPLWKTIPSRPRYFDKLIRVAYFFGGKGSRTGMHFDREHCCNLHLCLSGKKRVLLFTSDQNDKVGKVPFFGDTVIDFSKPLSELCQKFPKLDQAEGYQVTLETGDMLFMPKNCWHYTEYLDASSSATYVFYPRKILQLYGYLTGYFYWGYHDPEIFKLFKSPLYKKMSKIYALSTGYFKFF